MRGDRFIIGCFDGLDCDFKIACWTALTFPLLIAWKPLYYAVRVKNVPAGAKFAEAFSILKFVQTYYTLTDSKLVKDFITKLESYPRYVLFVFLYELFMSRFYISFHSYLSLAEVAKTWYNYPCSKPSLWSLSQFWWILIVVVIPSASVQQTVPKADTYADARKYQTYAYNKHKYVSHRLEQCSRGLCLYLAELELKRWVKSWYRLSSMNYHSYGVSNHSLVPSWASAHSLDHAVGNFSDCSVWSLKSDL